MRKFLIGLAAALVVVVALVLIVPSFIDWNRFKGEIEQQATAATGRALTIEGDIGFSVLPTPALSVQNVKLANVAGGTEPIMLSLQRLDAQVSLIPLLSGNIEVATFRLVEPVLHLETLADGTNNWTLTPDPASPESETDDAVEAGPNSGAPDLRLDEVLITDGTVTYRDAAAKTEFRLTGVTMNIFVGSLNGPFRLSGEFALNGVPLGLETSVGTFDPERAVPVNLLLDVGKKTGRVDFRGSVAEPGPDIRVSGAISIAGPDLANLVSAAETLAGMPAAMKPSPFMMGQPYRLELELTAARDLARFRDVLIELGGSSLSGSGAVEFGDITNFDITLAASTINLDSILAAAHRRGQSKQTGAGAPASTGTSPDDETTALSIPPDISGTANFSAEAITFNQGSIRNVNLDVTMANGVVNLRDLSAQLPGSTGAQLTGTVTTADAQPTFAGNIGVTAESLRNLLTWAGLDVDTVPPSRLARLDAKAQLQVTPELAQIYNIDAALDSSRLTGGIAYALRERPSFGIDLKVDRFNADAYLAPDAASDDNKPPSGRAGTRQEAAESPLALLNTFDSNFKLALDALTYRGVPVAGIAADGTLVGGTLTLRNGSVADIAGTAITVSGTVKDLAARPTGTMNLRTASNDVSGIARLANVALPVPGNRLGKAKMSASLTLADKDANAAIEGRLGDTDFQLETGISDLPATLVPFVLTKSGLNAKLKVRNASLANLIYQFDLPLAPPAGRAVDAPVEVTGTLSGNQDRLAADLRADVAGGKATLTGNLIDPLGTLQSNVDISLNAPSLTAFLRGLGVEFQPAARNLGGLAFSAKLDGNAKGVKLADLNSSVGPVNLQGTAQAKFDGAKPYFRADVAASEVLADLFLPVERQGTGSTSGTNRPATSSPTAAPPWSRQPLDLSALGAFDADVNLRAAGISIRGYDFKKPELTFTQRNGVAELKSLTGNLYGGAVDIRARLQGGNATPAFAASLQLQDADIEAATAAIIGKPVMTGRFNMSGETQGSGTSEFTLISNLSGKANIAATSGVFRGIDLPAFSERLDNLNRPEDFLGLVGGAFSGGETAYSRMTVPLTITDGIVRTGDVVMDIEAATGDISATVDLPRYQIDSQASFALSDHPDAPPLRMSFKGPLDNPVRNIGTREIEAFFTQRLLSQGLERLLGKKEAQPPATDGPATEQPAPVEQAPQPVDPAEQILQDVLKGVFGGR